ncbi:MAG: nuclear transport factor 2 family protein [Planctomycetes bacterium]|nr:nuclear transport factor 2 family protein [Planctomycetota bacterium]
MNAQQAGALAERFLGAWNSQEVDRVLACYTEDVTYRDPNTRGDVQGTDALRRYLTKLFGAWRMHWSLRECYPLADADGAAVLWHAVMSSGESPRTVEVDGMDLVLVHQDRIRRNEVYFDRTALAPLMPPTPK